MNLPEGDHATGLMEHSQVTTFLHEFGHMIHGMFGGHTRWFGQSGVATEWDFVEAPSQMLENWVYDYDTLARFAVNKDGQTIPRDLVERMNKARYFNLGLGDMTQLGYSNISLQFHQNAVPADLGAATRQWRDQYAIVPAPDWVAVPGRVRPPQRLFGDLLHLPLVEGDRRRPVHPVRPPKACATRRPPRPIAGWCSSRAAPSRPRSWCATSSAATSASTPIGRRWRRISREHPPGRGVAVRSG